MCAMSFLDFQFLNIDLQAVKKIGLEMITSIFIRNFRSIERQEIKCNWITTLVGENDAGKSNILRALNLFFNDQTDPDIPFNFDNDFNRFATVGKQKAKEIEIRIRFLLPDGYQNSRLPDEIEWRKVWRKNGIMLEKGFRRYVDRREFPSRSKIPSLLDRIRFTYIPAIKDQRFFLDLQGQLYDVLASVAAAPLKASATTFEEQLQRQLSELLKSINFAFDENSTLRLPDDLRSIFERLEINTNGIPLSRRGDGVKIRHIPMILRFIAEKHDNILNRGGVRYTHVWGFEEPENSVEMSACFEMVEQFIDAVSNSDRLQLFLTTHSPVFYAMEDPGEADGGSDLWIYKYFVEKQGDNSQIFQRTLSDVHESMGLMPIVAPHIEEIKFERDRALSDWKSAEAIAARQVPTIFVEGQTDEIVLAKAFEVFAPEFEGRYIFDAGGVEGYGSANAVASRAVSWQLEMRHRKPDSRVKAIAIFDDDNSGKTARKSISSKCEALGITPRRTFKSIVLGAPPCMRELKVRKFDFTIDLEAYYDDLVWDEAERKSWLEDIDDETAGLSESLLRKEFSTHEDPRDTLSHSERRRVTMTFTSVGKVKAAEFVRDLPFEPASIALGQFEPLVREILGFFFPKK